jgi:putative salt-induced outer membrane protein YdiY
MRPTLPLCVAVVVLIASAASADELRLTNGDRYSGTVMHLTAGTLTFKTPHGSLAVPWADVAALTIDEAIIVTTAGGQEQTVPGGAIDLASTTALTRPQPPLVVTGGAGAGVVETGGNTTVSSLRLDGDMLVRARDNRYTVAAAINRAEDRSVTTAQNWTSSARYDRFLTPRVFVNGHAIFTNDRFRDLDLRAAYGAGLGYEVFDTPRLTLNVDAGIGYVNENFDVAEDDSYAALREAGKLDVVVVPDRVTIFHQHDGYFGVTGDDNLFVRAQNGVRFSLVAGFVTTMRLDLDYDRSPAPGRRSTDRTFALTLGYRF